MKSIIICLLLAIVANSAYSQQTTPAKTLTKQDYLKKSKNQKLAAWLFLAGGGTAIALGARDVDPVLSNAEETRSTALIVTGIATLSISTTLFIASARNKKKAEGMTFNFKMEKAPVIQQGGFAYSSYPAVSLRLKL